MNVTRSASAQRVLWITFLAAALQLWGLAAQSLWYDEGFSVWLAQQPVGEIVTRTASDIHPPFYYLLLHGWIALAGTSEWALRFLSAFFAILSVPLLWRLAARLLRQPVAAEAVALMAALSPLWLWYGREARMYALSLALLAAAALLLLRLMPPRGTRGRWGEALAFALLATVGVYTHFYLWFVLAAWGIAAAWSWLRAPQRRTLGPLVAAFALPLLAYLPWLGITLTRLNADRSYWAGTLSWREVADETLASWMVGHSMAEALAVPLGWLGAALALLGALLLAARLRRPVQRSALLARLTPSPPLPFATWLLIVLWLLLPALGLFGLSWNRPKFHPRYLIFAAPAFLMLLGALVGWCAGRRWAGRLVGRLLLLGVLAIFLLADWNLYTNPAFAKADWRGVARYLAAHRQPDEPILLVSGHVFPVFHYYFPSHEGVLYLPDSPTLDTSEVLGLDTGQRLADAFREAPGVWLVAWQNEVVDPEGIVPAMLTAAGTEGSGLPRFMEVGLDHWTLPTPNALAEVLRPDHATDANFDDALRLLGWQIPARPSVVDEGLSLMLFWEAPQPLQQDFKVRLRVVDSEGFEYGTWDQRPTAYLLPTFRWQPHTPRLASLAIPLEPGTPPGDYWVELSVYEEGSSHTLDVLDEAGAPQGQTLRLGPIPVAPSVAGWLAAEAPSDATPLHAPMLDNLELLAARLALPATVEPGQQVPLTLWWRAAGPVPGATLHLGWERGSLLLESGQHALGAPSWTGDKWQPGDMLMTPLAVRAPRELEPGLTRLVAWLSDGAGALSPRVTLGSGIIVPAEHNFVPPAPSHPQQAQFGEEIRLLGYELSTVELAPDSPVTLTLHWEALAEMERSYTAFAHLLAPDGSIVVGGGQDKLPLAGERLTDSWVAGEFLSDTFQLALPSAAPPGPYTVEIGWYDAGDPALPRLPARGSGADRDRVLLDEPLRDGR